MGDEVKRESERMLVDDWEADNGMEGSAENGRAEGEPEESKEARTRDPVLVKRDEFSYSLLEALTLRRQMIQADDEDQLNRYNTKANEIFRRLLTDGVVT